MKGGGRSCRRSMASCGARYLVPERLNNAGQSGPASHHQAEQGAEGGARDVDPPQQAVVDERRCVVLRQIADVGAREDQDDLRLDVGDEGARPRARAEGSLRRA